MKAAPRRRVRIPVAAGVTRHLAIVGPTASGKSAVALAVAAACDDIEIVSLDSMQVYRGMDIGTAKPTPAERSACPPPSRRRRRAVAGVVGPRDPGRGAGGDRRHRGAGRRALLVGGTGLYVRAVVDGLRVPPQDLDVRRALELDVATGGGLARAYDRLVAADPVAAARIEPGNSRRIVRALEVLETTGQTFSSFGAGLAEYGPPAFDVALVGVWLPRAELNRRVAARFAVMQNDGLEAEVRALRGRGLSRTAAQAIGYKEVLAHLDGEIPTAGEAFDLAVRRTRQFARRQRVWFRRDPRIAWIGTARNPEALAAVVLAGWGRTTATLAAGHS